MLKKQITIGFSIHRPEIIPMTADLMQRHKAIFLEEPPAPGLQRMLQGRLSVDDYLLPIDTEYPEFSRSMGGLLRELYQNGKKIIQVEPFLQNLLAIHSFFSQGRRPEELKPGSVRYQVYSAERNATEALLAYYQKYKQLSLNHKSDRRLGQVQRMKGVPGSFLADRISGFNCFFAPKDCLLPNYICV